MLPLFILHQIAMSDMALFLLIPVILSGLLNFFRRKKFKTALNDPIT